MGSASSKPQQQERSSSSPTAAAVAGVVETPLSAPSPSSSSSSAAGATSSLPPEANNNNNNTEDNNTTSSSKCPMHNRADGTYSYDWRALFRTGFPHGPSGSKPLSKDQVEEKVRSVVEEAPSSSSCPVRHNNNKQSRAADAGAGSGCPMSASSQSQYPQYNVYSQPIDPNNQMPASNPNQLPAPNQSRPLSTTRISSTIPKGGATAADNNNNNATTTWTYPSPQMFYNALARKGKIDENDIQNDMDSVVHIHNHMNEKTWKKILQWENVVAAAINANTDANDDDGTPAAPPAPPQPKLLRFQGRPSDLSPKAYFKHYILGHPLPYDRHDWIIERPDGTTVRYVIDYYHDDNLAREDAESAKPNIHDDETATPSLLVDVRPALDSVSNAWQRSITMPYARRFAETTSFQPLPLFPSPSMKTQVSESIAIWQSIQQQKQQQEGACGGDDATSSWSSMSKEEAKNLTQNFARILSGECQEQQAKVDRCNSETECARASLDLNLCMGNILCPLQHEALMQQLHKEDADDSTIEEALARVNACITTKSQQHQRLTGRGGPK